MLNLLPQQEQEQIIAGYRMRFGITVALFVALLFVIASVGLLPAYLSERAETNVLIKAQEEAEQKNTAASLEEARALEASNKVLADYLQARIGLIESSPSTSDIVNRIMGKRGSDIAISNIEVASKLVVIQGRAATRSSLISFLESLKAEKDFRSAVLPIANLAKNTDASFAIQITLP